MNTEYPTWVNDRVLKSVSKTIADSLSMTAKKLIAAMEWPDNRGTRTLAGVILSRLGWRPWNAHRSGGGGRTWINPDQWEEDA